MQYLTGMDTTQLVLIIFGTGLIVALLLRWLLGLYTKRLESREHTAFMQIVVVAIRVPLYWSVIAVSAALSLYLLNLDQHITQILFNVIASLVIIIWTLYLSLNIQRALHTLAINVEQKHHRAVTDAIPFTAGLCRAFLFVLALYLLFLTWGINLTPLLASLSIVGAALSFAARDSVSNVISGLGIFLSRPFKVGDYITIDEKYSGTVIETTLQLTKLKTPEKTIINIPNSIIVTKTLQNHNAINTYYRLVIPFALPISTSIPKVTNILLKAAEKNNWVLDKPMPRVRLQAPTDKTIVVDLIVMLEKSTKAKTVTSQIVKATLPALHALETTTS